jgi:heterodisulfide reductase subunit A-like polyferredoxin
VIPVNESIPVDLEVAPYESVTDIVDQSKSWGVLDCICRVQKSLIGDPCEHPVDVCMAMSTVPGAFDHSSVIKALSREEAHATLDRAAEAGLVHSVSNSQEGLWYVCNCCTCSCGILRGMAEMGVANVVAKSSFMNTVDADLCTGCEECLPYCQFSALTLDGEVMTVSDLRCTGCGVCVSHCEAEAMTLIQREVTAAPPLTEMDWMAARAESRGKDLDEVL